MLTTIFHGYAWMQGFCSIFRSGLPQYAGRKTQYTYAAVVETHGDGLGDSVGLVKLDLTSSDGAVAATLRFGEGRKGGEAVFVPRSTNAAELKGEGHACSVVDRHTLLSQ